jgi:voltage-gated potassium channel Kch
MLYFSAATITTLGIGDISPITAAARVAVSLELILGIVLIGLFLNSLSQKRQQA